LSENEVSELNLVKKTCKELGITQKQLAERIGVSKTTISDWANEKTEISKIGKNILELLKIEKDFINFKRIIGESLKDKVQLT
jgi:transcriptional regulator with XRE-family HTH domain